MTTEYVPDPVPPHRFMEDDWEGLCDLCTLKPKDPHHDGDAPRYSHSEYSAIVRLRKRESKT